METGLRTVRNRIERAGRGGGKRIVAQEDRIGYSKKKEKRIKRMNWSGSGARRIDEDRIGNSRKRD